MAAVIATAVLAGCGLQGQAGTAAVSLTVTRDFGSAPVASATVARPPAGATALALLEHHFRVAIAPGGSVREIDGLQAGPGERWRLYVDGVAAPSRTLIHAGERLWWDLESSSVHPLAVVGSFPEPFLHGLGGRRYPTTLECAGGMGVACRRVTAVLNRAGVPVSGQALGTGSGQDSLTLVVGTWREVSGELAAVLLAAGPGKSGVFARFAGRRGTDLELLGLRGQVVATLGPGAGLVAPLATNSTPPIWLVLGTNTNGVSAAARAFSAARLHNRFALAVTGNRDVPVPR